ncbi:MAG: 2-amino-4-hydroxy-6-hydroxymethyldihydropteridine diphosphokinase [Moraxellaceae bacterium]|nr:2-amino-4-hydroxy-6-hydroxymethyldihydropteridine diphosphokinase [Moraxellaceae bacterium]
MHNYNGQLGNYNSLITAKLLPVSRLYGSKPAIGSPSNQPDYVNAAVLLHTTLNPLNY